MMNRQRTLVLSACILSVIILIYVPVSTIFISLILGLLLLPVLVFAIVFLEGVPIIIRELKGLIHSGKELFLISITKESITLEPQFR